MARKPQNYWERRSTELMLRLEKGTENTINSLIQAYEQATKDINKEITKIFNNFAKDTGLKRETLLKMLNSRETKTHYKNLLQVINNNITDENIKKKLLAKYNAPAYSYRISRYEAMQQNIDIELKKLANIEQQITEIRYVDTIKEAYYHNIYDIQKGTGLDLRFAQMDNRTIQMMLTENWVNKGNFSKRIWNNNEKLENYLRTQFTADTMSGKSISKISKELSEYMNVGLYMATRLVRTETNYFANQAELLSMQECGIEKYVYMATLDNITCERCAELDGKKFYVKDAKKGINCPPMHSNDRCGIVLYFDEEELEGLQRRARDENGKSILVPQNMTYQEWKEQYVDNNLKTKTNNGIIKHEINNEVKVVQYIGKLDKEKLGKYKEKIITDKVILTNERIEHTEKRHPGDYEKYINYLPKIIKNPDYILEDKDNIDTILMLSEIKEEEKNIQVVVRLQTNQKEKDKYNSILTFWHIRERNYKSAIKNNKIIYQKLDKNE